MTNPQNLLDPQVTPQTGATCVHDSVMSKKRKQTGGHPGGSIVCPDCGRRSSSSRKLVHDPTCPAAGALDQLMVEDAKWFGDHPGAEHRCRWITPAELMEFGPLAGRQLSPHSVIHVQQLEPGVRARAVFVPGDESVADGVMALFGHPSTFALVNQNLGPLPSTATGMLPSGLEVRLYSLPEGVAAGDLAQNIDIDGLVVLLPGASLPVPFS